MLLYDYGMQHLVLSSNYLSELCGMPLLLLHFSPSTPKLVCPIFALWLVHFVFVYHVSTTNKSSLL